jgi:hypothetical protein
MSTRERTEHVLALLANGDPDEAIAALIAAQRDGYRFDVLGTSEGVRIRAVMV